MIELTSHSEEETRALARRLAGRLRAGDVVALDGPLGAGKTCFVRGLAEGLGLDADAVSSPTFVLCQEYEPAAGGPSGRLALIHIDGYRLAGPEELETIGGEDLLRADDAVIAVEWAERLGAALPPARVHVELSHVDETTRSIAITASPGMAERIERPGLATAPAATSPCPICRTAVARSAETFPFCSSRCRLVDLGQWLGGGYRVSRPVTDADES